MLEFIVPFTDKADVEKFDRYHGTNGELVRCKDCRHWHEDIGANTKWLMCHEIVTDRNWFCADGERRVGE